MNRLKTIESGTIWRVDDIDSGSVVRSADVKIEIYPNWVCIKQLPTDIWVPRELVEQIHGN